MKQDIETETNSLEGRRVEGLRSFHFKGEFLRFSAEAGSRAQRLPCLRFILYIVLSVGFHGCVALGYGVRAWGSGQGLVKSSLETGGGGGTRRGGGSRECKGGVDSLHIRHIRFKTHFYTTFVAPGGGSPFIHRSNEG